MNDFTYEVLQRMAATVAFKEHTSYDSDLYLSAREKYLQNLFTKELTPGESHTSQLWYIYDVLEKYEYYLERGKKIGISNPSYASQFSNKVSYTEISNLTYDEIADAIYQMTISSNLPGRGVVYFYGCECSIPIYPIRSLLELPEVQAKLKKRIVKHYKRTKNNQKDIDIDISTISFELKDVDGGDYLIIIFPEQINYEDGMEQFIEELES